MRIVISLLVLLLFLPNTTAQDSSYGGTNAVEQIKIAGNIRLELIASDSMFIQFDSESVPESMRVEWLENKLILITRSELKKAPVINVKAYYTNLSGLEITRGAQVLSADTIESSLLSLSVDTGGKAEFSIKTDSLSARVNQGADIILQGCTRSQSINAGTVGNFLAYELKAQNSWVKAATGAQVKLYSSKYLNASSVGRAFVAYLGNPKKTEFKSSLGGKIIREEK